MISFDDVRNQSRKCQSFPARVYRPVYDRLTYMFLKLGWSANRVSILMAELCLFGGLLMILGNFYSIIIGVLLFILADIVDYCDGAVARLTNTVGSCKGLTYDDVHHWAESTVFFIAFGLYYMKESQYILWSTIIIALVYISVDKFREAFLLRAGYSANMKMRTFPFVLFYGGFTEWVKYVMLFGFVTNTMQYVITPVLIWSVIRMIVVPIVLAERVDEVKE